jgi:hypothetical protein
MPNESRGRLNIATCLLTGSMETTIIVSVLNVPSWGRWSTPTRRMFRRSVPSHGWIVASGRADPWIGGGVTWTAGVSSGPSVGPVEPEGDASELWSHWAWAWSFCWLPMKTQGSLRIPWARRS